MDVFTNLAAQMALLTQQVQRKQLAYGQHLRVECQVWNLYVPMEQVQYKASYNQQHHNPYLNTYNSKWQHHSNLSWNAPQPPQENRSNLEDAMAKLINSMAEIENAQFKNEVTQPLQEKMTSLEEAMVELAKSQAEFAKSQT